MRLFYQSFGVSRGSRGGRYGQVLKSILDRVAAPGTEISIHGLSPHPAIAEQYRYLEFLDKAEVMDNGLRAEKEGYDAVVLGNDPAHRRRHPAHHLEHVRRRRLRLRLRVRAGQHLRDGRRLRHCRRRTLALLRPER